MVCIVMALVSIVSAWSLGDFSGNVQDAAAEKGLRSAALALFVFLRFPFAVTIL
jgi:solute carrier family 45, member 1/2/4